MTLHPKLAAELTDKYREMKAGGDLLTLQDLEHYYGVFRSQFGPERLQDLDGQGLLYKIHALSSSHRDSIVYWLEFKNDDEFPTTVFGSIAGGSALKYGIYQRKEDGAWMTGSPQNQQELTEGEAVDVARKHRDQLLRGVELLDTFPSGAGDEAYQQLQETMEEAAPDIADSAWGHKYFHMLFPDKLDDYHVAHYQRFHLIKLLQVPPQVEGRYVCGGRFVAVAHELGMPINHLAGVLNERNTPGRPYSYWRIGTKLGGEQSIWDMMLQERSVAIGWPEVGDLSYVTYDRSSKNAVREALEINYPNDPRVIGRKTQEIFNFVAKIEEGDVVLPSDGRRVLGIARVVGDYAFVDGSDAPHRRPVEWLSLDAWEMPEMEGLRTTVFPIRKHDENLVEVERHILEGPGAIETPTPPIRTTTTRLGSIAGRIQAVLERKKQVILYGPPGTGKTYWARKAAQDLAALSRFSQRFDELAEEQRQTLLDNSGAQVRMCTFHPAYGYEDFLEGFRPNTVNQQLVFEERDGIFKRLCDDAHENPSRDFYLVIDEINRGDIPRIFGELLTILEADKREQAILLPLSREPFFVPRNVYIIATMNTADRSIALLDTALRRRFGFIELMPDVSVLRGVVVANTIPLGPWLTAINERIMEHVGRDARNLQIGHAYLLHDGQPVADFQRLSRVLREDIIPLLQEYCYEDYPTLARILGESLVDVHRQRIREELFEPDRRDDLVQALLEPEPELAASSEIFASEAESQELEEEEQMVAEEDGAV